MDDEKQVMEANAMETKPQGIDFLFQQPSNFFFLQQLMVSFDSNYFFFKGCRASESRKRNDHGHKWSSGIWQAKTTPRGCFVNEHETKLEQHREWGEFLNLCLGEQN